MAPTVRTTTRLLIQQNLKRLALWATRASDRLERPISSTNSTGRRYGPLRHPQTESEAIRSIFNTDSPESFEEGGRSELERLAPYFNETSTVLDLGCGIGRVAKYIAANASHLWAVDASPQMLHLARQRLGSMTNISYTLCNDVSFSEVPSNSVDLAYSLLVLQHLEREDAFLLIEELRRVIRPDGVVVLTFPNLLSDIYLESFLNYAHTGAATQVSRARVYTPQEVERLLPAAGFRVEDLDAGTDIRAVCYPT